DTPRPTDATPGVSRTRSRPVDTPGSPLAPGYYCFRAEAHTTNSDNPASYTDTTNECFRVKETTTTTTAQDWLPNDTATVLKSNNAAASGTVTFSLYENGTCTGTAAHQFAGIALGSDGKARTNNTTIYTASQTISWRVAFTS